MKKTLVAGLSTGLMMVGLAGMADATTMTSDLNDVIAAGGQLVTIPGSELSTTNSILDPFGGTISLSSVMEHRIVGSSWVTWSSTYGDPSGLDILYSQGVSSATLTFSPDSVVDFGFELEPNPYSTFTFTLLLDNGLTLTQDVSGSAGALAFGFIGGDVRSLTISGGSDFAIGRLYIDTNPVPEPATMLLFGAGLAGLAAAGRRKVQK